MEDTYSFFKAKSFNLLKPLDLDELNNKLNNNENNSIPTPTPSSIDPKPNLRESE